jgi:DNA-binding IclR family transcriptional regulator
MSKTTVHRLLTTLETKRFISRDKDTGMYRLGFRIVEMASLVLQDMELRRWVQPYLKNLSELYGETVDLSVLDGSHVIYLDVIESPRRVKLAAATGQSLPAYFTASGKALLAFAPAEQVVKILADNFAEHNGESGLTVSKALEDLGKVAERGYAVSEQEYEEQINAVSAPIFDSDRRAVASIAIVGPSFRLSSERLPELGESIRKIADEISREIGMTALSGIVAKTRSR